MKTENNRERLRKTALMKTDISRCKRGKFTVYPNIQFNLNQLHQFKSMQILSILLQFTLMLKKGGRC